MLHPVRHYAPDALGAIRAPAQKLLAAARLR
jgi:hypothetical protein